MTQKFLFLNHIFLPGHPGRIEYGRYLDERFLDQKITGILENIDLLSQNFRYHLFWRVIKVFVHFLAVIMLAGFIDILLYFSDLLNLNSDCACRIEIIFGLSFQ